MPIRIREIKTNGRDATSYGVDFYDANNNWCQLQMHFAGSLVAVWQNKQINVWEYANILGEKIVELIVQQKMQLQDFKFDTYNSRERSLKEILDDLTNKTEEFKDKKRNPCG
jgi:hypothetical protein